MIYSDKGVVLETFYLGFITLNYLFSKFKSRLKMYPFHHTFLHAYSKAWNQKNCSP